MNRRKFIGATGVAAAVAVSPIKAESEDVDQVFNAGDKDARYIVNMKSERFETLTEPEAKAELLKVKTFFRENGINAIVTFDLENVFKL